MAEPCKSYPYPPSDCSAGRPEPLTMQLPAAAPAHKCAHAAAAMVAHDGAQLTVEYACASAGARCACTLTRLRARPASCAEAGR